MRRLFVLLVLLLVSAVQASELRVSWDPPPTVPPGVTITGYFVAGCQAPLGGTTCPPIDLPQGQVGPTVRTWLDTNVVAGSRYCYAVVTLGTGAKQPRSVPSAPVVCAVVPLELMDAPLAPQNVRATVP